MGFLTRCCCGAALAAGLIATPVGASAQGQPMSALRVGARVAPLCTISIDGSVTGADRSPAVRVACSRSGLRALRVTTSRGDSIRPASALTDIQRQAAAEVVFVVPVVLATVASRLPVIAMPPPPDRSPLTVTLDF